MSASGWQGNMLVCGEERRGLIRTVNRRRDRDGASSARIHVTEREGELLNVVGAHVVLIE